MRPRTIVSIIAAGLILAMCPFTAGAAGPQSWGKLDRGTITAAEWDEQCTLSVGEVAVLAGADGPAPSQVAEQKGLAGRLVARGDRFAILDVGQDAAGVDFDDPSLAPVFRAGSGVGAPFLFPTGEVIVKFKIRTSEARAASWAGAHGLTLVRPMVIANAFLLKAANPSKSLEAAASAAASDEASFCVPNWTRQVALRQEDPLYPYQWHLKNTGEVRGTVAGNDINVEPVWPSYRGSADQILCIVDDGLEIAHADLAANIVPGLSWDFVRQQADPTSGDHGTACGGVAAARGFNGIGVRGVAPEAGLCGHRIIDGRAKQDAVEAEAESMGRDRIGAYSNSWGPYDDGQRIEAPRKLTAAAMTQGISDGRGGKGVLYVWAGGNGLTAGDNSNYDGYANWRYTIAVGASTSAGKQSYYSERGANLCVNAPSSGGTDKGIATVDRTGPIGYNKEGVQEGNFADLDFTNDFGGTSSACPAVAGVCALVLQANPNLGWRDVKQILMTTASKNDPADADWTTNAAGYHVNHKYGFGRVDAAAAVEAAAAWTNLAPEVASEGTASPRLAIPTGGQEVSSTITLTRGIVIESVEVYFTADHGNWGDLSVVLTSPSGTSSVLAEKHDTSRSSSRYNEWRFGSERYLGEMSAGDWTLTVRDLGGATTGGTFTAWTLVAYGTDPDATAVSLATDVSPLEGGTVSPAGTTRLYAGVAAGIAASAAPGYYFTEWVASPEEHVTFGFGGRKSPETTVALSGDATLTARFSTAPPAMATVDFAVFPKWGGVTGPGERTTANAGACLAIAALPFADYTFLNWTAEPAESAEFASATSMSTQVRIKGDVKLAARFKAPDMKLTQGSAIQVPANRLGISEFSKAPKVIGSTPRKSVAMKVIGNFPSDTVTAEWPAKPKIYDPADYKNPAHGLGALLDQQPMAPVGLRPLVIDATKADDARLDLAGLGDCMLVPPLLKSVIGEFAEGSVLGLSGTYFGTKAPKVSVEYVKNGKYFTQSCPLVKMFFYTDASGKPSCMDPPTGESVMNVTYPALPSGAQPTGYLILENAIGMCSFYRPPR